MVEAGADAVGGIEFDPAQRRAEDGDPGVRSIGADELRFAGARSGAQIAADVASRQPASAQSRRSSDERSPDTRRACLAAPASSGVEISVTPGVYFISRYNFIIRASAAASSGRPAHETIRAVFGERLLDANVRRLDAITKRVELLVTRRARRIEQTIARTLPSLRRHIGRTALAHLHFHLAGDGQLMMRPVELQASQRIAKRIDRIDDCPTAPA